MSPAAVVAGLAGQAIRIGRFGGRSERQRARRGHRHARGVGPARPHIRPPRSGFLRRLVPTPITGRGGRTERERELLDSSKGRTTTGERQDVGSDLGKRGTRCDQVCANGRDRPCGDAFPSDEDRKTGRVVEHVAYLRQQWMRATRYARKPCRVAAAMAYALRAMCWTTWCDRPCGDNSRSGMDARRDHLCAARHELSGRRGGASSRRPDSGIADGSRDRLCARCHLERD